MAEADACPGIEVDAHGDRLVIHDDGQRLPVLQAVDFRRAEAKLLCGHLKVAPDDGCGHGKHLVRLRVYLHECLAVASVRGLHVHDDSLAVE